MTRKTQKKLRKLLTLVCCAVMLVCVTVGATVAYLTSQDQVVNTFTVGNVNITLDEATIDANGKAIAEDTNRTSGEQTYKVYPGGEYDKDPTVTVVANSEEAYIRMLVTVENYDNLKAAFDVTTDPFLLQNYVTEWDSATWSIVQATPSTDGKSCVYEFRYKETVNTLDGEKEVLPSLFETVKIPGDIDNEHLQKLNNVKITVVAQAIQADGFNTADAAWAAWPTNPTIVPEATAPAAEG